MPPENLKVTEVRKDYAKIAWSPPESDGGAPIKNYLIEKRDTAKMTWLSAGTVDSHTLDFKVRSEAYSMYTPLVHYQQFSVFEIRPICRNTKHQDLLVCSFLAEVGWVGGWRGLSAQCIFLNSNTDNSFFVINGPICVFLNESDSIS